MRAWFVALCPLLLAVSFACSDATADTARGSAGSGGIWLAAGGAGEAEQTAGNAGATLGAAGSNAAGMAGEWAASAGSGSELQATAGAGGTPSSASVAGAAGEPEPPGEITVTLPIEGAVASLAASLPLTPRFSASIHDYYVRCAAGENALTVDIDDGHGARASTINLLPNEAVVLGGQYWVRCLPPDFPIITVTRSGTPAPGYYLLSGGKYGAVFDGNGVPVWYARGALPTNVDSPAENTLSLMRGATQPGAYYEVRALAKSTVIKVASPDQLTDAHELRVLPNGDFLVFTAPPQYNVDLTGLGTYTASDILLGCEIEELDAAGQIVWSWLASDHVDPIMESVKPITTPVNGVKLVDAFHCNAIDVDSSGNLLVSMRHANAIFYIDRASGQVLWKLGGSAYNKDGASLIRIQNDPETSFSLQHDARFTKTGNVSLFDDHGMGTGVARGVEYALDHEASSATPVFQFLGLGQSQYEGSFRRYADGASLIGWGYVPNDLRVLTELDAQGNDIFDIAFDAGNITYRAIKVPLAQLDIELLRRDVGRD